jgi:hypothetical protein
MEIGATNLPAPRLSSEHQKNRKQVGYLGIGITDGPMSLSAWWMPKLLGQSRWLQQSKIVGSY